LKNPIAPGSQAEQVGRLLLAGALVLFLPLIPFGAYLLYPFVILTTWFHEMAHGLAAMLVGWDFQRLVILPDGSGFAESFTPVEAGRLKRAVVAAAGPLGPTVVGSLLILASGRRRSWRPALYALAGALIASTLIWVRSSVGVIVLPLVALILMGIARSDRPNLERFTLQFLGILAALSMLRDWNYLFTESAVIGGRRVLSDTGAIEAALVLPHWIWAGLITLLSALAIGASLKHALKEDGSTARR
jgi:hypothetical protein